jgi:hypothetical protein
MHCWPQRQPLRPHAIITAASSAAFQPLAAPHNFSGYYLTFNDSLNLVVKCNTVDSFYQKQGSGLKQRNQECEKPDPHLGCDLGIDVAG